MTQRLFFAQLPDETVLRQCSLLLKTLNQAGVRSVPLANLHVTLVFLGAVERQQQQWLIEQAKTLNMPPTRLQFDRLEFWKKPQVLCLTSQQAVADEMLAFIAELQAMARGAGLVIDERSFKPHVTLARKARGLVVIDVEPIVWKARRFCLVESCAGVGGVEYHARQWFG